MNAHKRRDACSLKDINMQVLILHSCMHVQYVYTAHIYDHMFEVLRRRGRDAILWSGSRAIYKQINYANAYGN